MLDLAVASCVVQGLRNANNPMSPWWNLVRRNWKVMRKCDVTQPRIEGRCTKSWQHLRWEFEVRSDDEFDESSNDVFLSSPFAQRLRWDKKRRSAK